MAGEMKIGAGLALSGEREFKQAISGINKDLSVLGSEMGKVTAQFGSNANSMDGLKAKSEVYNKQIDEQKKKIETLKAALENSAKEFGENDNKTKNWQIQLNKAEAQLAKTENSLNDTNDEMKNLGKSTDDTGGKFEKFGGVLKGVGVAVGAVAVAAGVAAAKMGAEVVKQFGELEQNLGGSEAVFGEYAASIQKSGEEAYKNLGVSQSDYLATANKMGALFQGSGVDQQKSLELTEKAMQRAADMASVMGIDMNMAMESVAGAAKGNYTMMDNLGVAMNETTLKAYALSKGLDYGEISKDQSKKAELAMQMFFEKTDQYAGNFEREATQTVTGSIGLMQAAWGSFTAGLGNENADMENLTQNLVDGFNAVVANVVPIIENLVSALPTAFRGILPAIGSLLPPLLDTVTSLFQEVLTTVLALMPELIPAVVAAVVMIADTLIENLPLIIDGAFELIMALANGIIEALPELTPKIVAVMVQIVKTIVENLPQMAAAALKIIVALAAGLITSIPELIKAVPELVVAIKNAFVSHLENIKDIGKNIVKGIWQGITSMTNWLANKVKGFVDSIVSAFTGKDGIDAHSPSRLFAKFGGYMAQGIGVGFEKEMSAVTKQINNSIPTDVTMTGQYQATAKMGEGIVNGLSGLMQQGNSQPIIFQTFLNGKMIAQEMFDPLRNVAKQRGVALG